MRYLTLIVLLASLIGCHKPSPNTLTIGTISGPETELVETARDVALEKYGLTIKIMEFNDYNLPNEALQDGSLDANVYQHLPYLTEAINAHHYTFDVIGKTFVYPTGIYSNRIKSLKQLAPNNIIAIPNDPSNEARALLLLQKAGLITLTKNNATTLADIAINPLQLRIKELDAAQLPRILNDVDAAVINTSFAIPAGLNPSKDALYLENKDSPYANLIVINRNSTKKTQLKEFVKALNSPEVAAKARLLFGDTAIVAW